MQTKAVRKTQHKNRMRWGVVTFLVAALIGIGLFVVGPSVFGGNDEVSSDDGHGHGGHEATAEEKVQADKVFKKYLVRLAASKTKYSAENYTPSSDSPSAAVITGREAYDLGQKTVATSLSYACTATVQNTDISLNVSVQTDNTDTYVRLNNISGQAAGLVATNAKAKGIWYKTSQPNIATQAQLDSGIFVFSSGVLAPDYDAKKVADVLVGNNVYGYVLDRHVGGAYTFDITTRKDKYAVALKQAFPNLTSSEAILDALFANNATELESSLTIHEDGTVVNELGLRSDACPEQAKLYLGPEGTQDTRTPGTLKALSVNKSADEASITPITRWKPASEYGK